MQVHEFTQERLVFLPSKVSFSADLQTFSIYLIQFIFFNAEGVGIQINRDTQACESPGGSNFLIWVHGEA